MKKSLSLLLCAVLLSGCSNTLPEASHPVPESTVPAYSSRFDTVTEITLSDSGISVNGAAETHTVFTSRDIIYYENRDTYASGNPYGEGTDADKHSVEEAAAHTVVNITAPGTYRISGKLSAGQIRIDLGEKASKNPDAVVELILSDADITCTVAPAILFLNTYECDKGRSEGNATPDMDTSSAGANLILEGQNIVTGSYVAKIFKDKGGEKKLWKQDGAICSYMSMNVYGPGALKLNADNEGLATELHLTINGGNITVCSQNDGINTSEDGVSVTTVNDGNLTIYAGLGAEGDGIDSNGYLVINGGTVISSAKSISDSGLDSGLGTFIHGGIVVATGSTENRADKDSRQVTMNVSFASAQTTDSEIRITAADGTEIFTFVSAEEPDRNFHGLILSHPSLTQGKPCHVFIDDIQMTCSGIDFHMNDVVNTFTGVSAAK